MNSFFLSLFFKIWNQNDLAQCFQIFNAPKFHKQVTEFTPLPVCTKFAPLAGRVYCEGGVELGGGVCDFGARGCMAITSSLSLWISLCAATRYRRWSLRTGTQIQHTVIHMQLYKCRLMQSFETFFYKTYLSISLF